MTRNVSGDGLTTRRCHLQVGLAEGRLGIVILDRLGRHRAV